MDGLLSVLGDEVVQTTFQSLRVSATAVAAAAIIGIPLGTLLALVDFRGRHFVLAIINTLMGLPPILVGLVFYLLLSRSGFLGPLELLYTPFAMVIVQFTMALPITTGLSVSAVSGVPQSLIENSKSLGATSIQQVSIIFRESRVGVLASIVAAFGGAISEIGAIMLVGGNIRYLTRTLTTSIYLYTSMGEFSTAIELGIILLATAFAVNALLTYLQMRDPSGRRVPKAYRGLGRNA